ncbi:SDR family oxidoreductase [Marinigracilibium pacificum]|uniref:SDR family oxidoreductase n=1 Tax=Marinigracilibium pacificum TaxID=2729599 RepID=A0A848IYZ2_9BACT|nr:SDR family oxidoreductase [Marinigracilibium pacificum]NMM48856.1 SDR family oxidoreductase [Marinigracilibium pacificum]
MEISLKGRRALVCGSSRGIGKAIAIALAGSGASVLLMSRDKDKLKEVISVLDTTSGQEHDFIVADFNEPHLVEKRINKYLESGKNIDILINNTGGPSPGLAFESEPELYQKAFSAHLIVNQILLQATLPHMQNQQFGRIINIISTSVKAPIPGLGVSNTIRGAVANWSKTISVELAGFGITVNNILPGLTKTDRLKSIIKNKAESESVTFMEMEDRMMKSIPVGRFAEPEEIADTVVFLASNKASYINGVSLAIDGGKTPVQ